jgi:hypothetical protein
MQAVLFLKNIKCHDIGSFLKILKSIKFDSFILFFALKLLINFLYLINKYLSVFDLLGMDKVVTNL